MDYYEISMCHSELSHIVHTQIKWPDPPSSKVIFKSRECENKASKYGILRKSSVINENDEEEFSI